VPPEQEVTGSARIHSGPLIPAQVTGVLGVAGAAAEADGVGPLSEHGLLRVRHGEPGQRHDLVATAVDTIVGYAYLDEAGPDSADMTGELVVDPAYRRQGLGTALVSALAAEADGHPIRLWAHGDLAAAAALARSAGFERFRALWQMRRSLPEPTLPESTLPEPTLPEPTLPEPTLPEPTPPDGTATALPDGIVLRTFRVGQDEEQWLRLNGRAFAKHPEQGAWTRRDIELREGEPWFDPDGFFIAERVSNGVMTGFHWTKIHPATATEASIGEVYVVGVDPDAHGRGLGKALTLAGLRYLRARGLDQVLLYVDEDNAAAIRMYSDLGFTRWRADAMYRRP
jgi:mycothiol synthase